MNLKVIVAIAGVTFILGYAYGIRRGTKNWRQAYRNRRFERGK